jgi:hypothetical protein
MKTFILATLLLASQAFAAELTLYNIPSPKGMDWSAPSKIAITALKNLLSFEPHFMGHIFIEIKCDGTHEYTGMTSKDLDYVNQLMLGGKGMGILYHSFEGHLEESNDVQKELADYFKNGGLNFAKFIVSENQCQRAAQYLKEFREKKVGRHYGLANRPRYGEGAGCTAFGVSFLDVLGILDQDMRESWSQTINIPLDLAGPPLRDESVSVFKVVFNSGSWAKDNEKHQKLTFWDPDKMYNWVKKKTKQSHTGHTIAKNDKVEGIVIDKSLFPVPGEPIWLQRLDPKDTKKTYSP